MSFLKTVRTQIDVHARTLFMKFGDINVKFTIIYFMKHPMEEHSFFQIELHDDLFDDVFLSDFDDTYTYHTCTNVQLYFVGIEFIEFEFIK